ncbi:MAG: class I adenylate-forming enzyme family protein [Pseudomonadota bacterium]
MNAPAPHIPGSPSTIREAVAAIAASRPGAEALVDRHARYTFEELVRAVDAFAAALATEGVSPCDRVAMAAGCRHEVVLAFLATQWLGAVWVGINPLLAGPEKVFQLHDCGVTLFIGESRAVAQIEAARAGLPDLRRIILLGEPGEASEFHALIDRHRDSAGPRPVIDSLAPAAIGYTSGTTGFPKGVVHSQRNMLVAAVSRASGVQADEGPADIRRGAAMGLSILNAIIRSGLTALVSGGCLVCIDRRDAEGIIEWIEREQVEAISLPSAILHDFLRLDFDPARLASLTLVGNSGSAVPEDVRQTYVDRFGHPVLVGYGLTEAPTVLTSSGIDRPFVPGGSGQPCGHIDVAILKPDGSRCATGEDGEICARARREGPWAGVWSPMLGYWNRPDATLEALRDGWLHTGDIGHFGDDDTVFVTGRKNDLIVRGGANVYPAEVERVLALDPGVRGAAVIGVPDARLGESVAALIELAEVPADTAEIEERLRTIVSRSLARYKVPERWRFVESLPRTISGKIVKAGLAEHFEAPLADKREGDSDAA